MSRRLTAQEAHDKMRNGFIDANDLADSEPATAEQEIAWAIHDPDFFPVRFDSKHGTLDFGGTNKEPTYFLEVGKSMEELPHLLRHAMDKGWYTEKLHTQVQETLVKEGWEIPSLLELLRETWQGAQDRIAQSRPTATKETHSRGETK